MTRLELYERVWSAPMRKLAPEFGVSDMALAQLCRKHAVPAPPRGYWAKLAAGHEVSRIPLPHPAIVGEILMPGGQARHAGRERTAQRRPEPAPVARSAGGGPAMRATLARCHPMVAAAAAFFDACKQGEEERRRPRKPGAQPKVLLGPFPTGGRYVCGGDGRIVMLATTANSDWLLRFADAVVQGLAANGATFSSSRYSGKNRCLVEFKGWAQRISFLESVARLDPLKGERESRYRSRNEFKVTVDRLLRPTAEWRGKPAELEADIDRIVREIIGVLDAEAARAAERRMENQEREARQRRYADEAEALRNAQAIEAAAQARVKAAREARLAQAARALKAGRAQLEYQATLRVLADLEERIPAGADGDGLRTWLEVARGGMTSPIAGLLADLQTELSQTAQPAWWPELLAGEHRSEGKS